MLQRFLTKDRGWGVRATATIPRGSFVVEYAGAQGVKLDCLSEHSSWHSWHDCLLLFLDLKLMLVHGLTSPRPAYGHWAIAALS
jgi:SET domain